MRNWKRHLREVLSLPALEGHRDQRAIDEMADHLEDLYREAVNRGCSEEEADALVLSWLGDPERAAEELTAAEPHHARAAADRWLEARAETLGGGGRFRWVVSEGLKDLRLGLRALRKRPLFTGVAVLVLGLGIGATSAIFTLVNAIVLSPLPFADADRLVAIHHTAPDEGIQDAGECAAWHFTYEDESRAFTGLGMYSEDRALLTGEGHPEAVRALEVTDGVFGALRIAPVAGRMFSAADMDPDGPLTVMLTESYWRTRFGGDPSAVGRTLTVNGTAAEIIGVAPDDVRALGVADPALVTPLRFRRSSLFVGNMGFGSVGRLRDGVSLQAAAADLNRVLPMAWEKFPGGPAASSTEQTHYTALVRPLKDDVVGSVGNVLWILLAGVGVVLLIACANVANLFLVRADGKEGEMAVRTAMGASRWRVGWEYVKESLLLGMLGGVVGLALAHVGVKSLLTMASADLPRLDEVHLDGRVLLFTLLVSLASGFFFGFLPALRHGRLRVADTLKEGGRGGTHGRTRRRAQDLLAVSQVALALVLLVASGLSLRSVQALKRVDPGFRDPANVLVVRLYIPPREQPDVARMAATYEAIAHRIAQMPGVSAVGLANAIPMDYTRNLNSVYVRGGTRDPAQQGMTHTHKWIGPDYLETLRIPLLAGRAFTWADIHARAPVAMLSERLARELFGSPQAAIGQYVAARPDPPAWKEVVGVVKDVREFGLDQDPPLQIYWPQVTLGFWERNEPDQVQSWRSMGLAIRSDRVGTPGFRQAVKAAIWDVNPNLPPLRMQTLTELMASHAARRSFTMVLLAIAGAVAVILSVVGVYGVISYAVSLRTREMGMRMALGAGRGRVVAMVVRQGAALAVVGIAIGLALAVGATRLMSAILFGVSPLDAATYAVAALGLQGVALLACWIPARRAARVDPVQALRTG